LFLGRPIEIQDVFLCGLSKQFNDGDLEPKHRQKDSSTVSSWARFPLSLPDRKTISFFRKQNSIGIV
jgi:hypothetical protein